MRARNAAFLVALAMLSTCLGKDDSWSKQRPNLMLVVSDQTRPDALSGAGGNMTIAETPNLDRIASEGVTFMYAFTATPICTPARAALITGRSPWRPGMRGYGNFVAPNVYSVWQELPETLEGAGYFTGIAGKNHFG